MGFRHLYQGGTGAMTELALRFSTSDRLGRITSVDTSRVFIDVEDPSMLTRVCVGNLIAIKGSTEQEYLIAITERVTRSLRDEILDDDELEEDELYLGSIPDDSIRAVLIGTYRTVEGEKKNVFKRGADSFPQIDRSCYFIESTNLQRFMGLLGTEYSEKERFNLGYFVADRTAAAIASGDKFFQRHASILGSTGSGKSWSVALILEKANNLKFPNIIALDMHGEYSPLTDKSDGFARGIRIAGPGDLDNPSYETLFLPYWLLNREEMLSMILDRSDMNAPNQASRFTLHVRKLKEKALCENDQSETIKTFTVDSPVPYKMEDLVAELKDDNTRKGVGVKGRVVKGEWEGKLTRFISRLEAKLDDRRYGFLFKPPHESLEYDWLGKQMNRLLDSKKTVPGIKIVDFSEVPPDVLPVVTSVLVRLIYDVQFWMVPDKRTPLAFFCDEAHLYLPVKEGADAVQKQALESFERIAKEGRKYGVSLIVISQRPSDVSKTILSQCNNFLVLRLNNDRDQAVVRRLVPDTMSGLTDILPLLDTGEAVLLGDAVLLPSRIKLDVPKLKPASATREFWTEWGSIMPDPNAINEAVELLRRQTRSLNQVE